MWTDADDSRSALQEPLPAAAGGQPPPPRPAILVGCGEFGQTLLRRFLTAAALRGALEWESPPGGASPAERYLRDLAVIGVDDAHGAPAGGRDQGEEPARLEVMRDLLGQIRTVETSVDQARHLADDADAAVASLLAAPVQYRRGGRPGLDVFVLAQPATTRNLGDLQRLVQPLMERLQNHNYLRQAGRTSFIAILDFDNYWDHSPSGLRLRQALRKAVDRWRQRRLADQPTFDRVYLVDGRAESGERSEARRIDEINLLLELMLFEGQRGELQRLFHAHTSGESPVYSFGVRVMERRSALLSRQAAAEFGRGWLDYLAGRGDGLDDVAAIDLRRRLEPYRPAALERTIDAGRLRRELDRSLDELERELVGYLREPGDDWLETADRRYREVTAELWQRIQDQANRRLDELSRERLSRLESDLAGGVEGDLHLRERPVPLGAVLEEVEAALAELQAVEPALPAPPADRDLLAGRLRDLSRRYTRFLTDRVHLERLQLGWVLLAVAATAGLGPLLGGLLRDVPQPGPLASRSLALSWDALQRLADPLATSLLVFVATWVFGGFWVHRRFRRRLQRVEEVFRDPDQGKLADRLRQALGPGGSLRKPLEERLEQLVQDMTLAVRSTVQRELNRVRDQLRERRREMGWLRRQLEEFSRVHGRSGGDSDGTEIRLPIEAPGEYQRMLASEPAEPARFRSVQRELRPFEGWDQPWCDAFLHPLAFIERLSARYRDPIERELSRPGEGPEQERWADGFLGFVERQGGSPLAFHWNRQQGLPPEERFCLLPPLWRHLSNVRGALRDIAVDDGHLLVSRDVARSYLLRIQGGVDPTCLVEGSAAVEVPGPMTAPFAPEEER